MTTKKLIILGILLAMAILEPLSSRAEEGGTGHYVPGLTASFIDALPGKTGFAVANVLGYYDGSADVHKKFPLGAGLTAGLDATVYSETLVVLYQPDWKLPGGYYVFGVSVPYFWTKVEGHVRLRGPGGQTFSKKRRDTANGFGDITVFPVMLGWTALGGDLKYDVRLGVYVPTGEYDKDDLANAGKNYWTFEPSVSLSYLSSKTGLEISAYAGVDFNGENPDTNYRTGDQFHLDVTVAEHLPILGGLVGLGANGFYYQQISGDSGSGAILGDFKGRTAGIGPVLSYATKLWEKAIVAEVKWLPEMDVKRRTEGDNFWFKLAVQF